MTPSTDTRVSALLQLAERCEKATGPDRELDAAIFNWMRDNAGLVPDRSHDAYPFYAYTASLDAAMQLVPADQGAALTIHEAIARCFSTADTEEDFRRRLPAFVTAAALRARAAS